MASISGEFYSKLTSLTDNEEIQELLKNSEPNVLIALFQRMITDSDKVQLTKLVEKELKLIQDKLNDEQLGVFQQLFPSNAIESTLLPIEATNFSLDNIGNLILFGINNKNSDLLNRCFDDIEKETGIRPSTNVLDAIEIIIEKPISQENLNRLSQIISAVRESSPSINIQVSIKQQYENITLEALRGFVDQHRVSIHSLELSQVNNDELDGILKDLYNLHHLRIRSNNIIDNGGSALSELRNLKKLQTVNLVCCDRLTSAPDFSECPLLQTVDLYGCTRLTSANFSGCPSLQTVILSRCTGLTSAPDFSGCSSLQRVNFSCCTSLTSANFSGCSSLQTVDLSRCTSLTSAPDFSECSSLQTVYLYGCTSLTSAPDFSGCPSLQRINFSGCTGLTSPPNFSGCSSLQTISLSGCTSLTSNPDFSGYSLLQTVDLSGCISLTSANFFGCSSLQTVDLCLCTGIIFAPDFSGCSSLQTVDFSCCNHLTSANFSGCSSLQTVDFSCCTSLTSAPDFSGCSSLQRVNFSGCTSLTSANFSGCSSLQTVDLSRCTSLTSAPDFSECPLLQRVNFSHCTSLTSANFSGCSSLQRVNFSCCTSLTSANFSGCSSLQTVDLSHCTSLTSAIFSGCSSLQEVIYLWCTGLTSANFSGCSSLQTVHFSHCTSLTSAPDFSGCSSLQRVNFYGCTSLTSAPDFSGCSSLQRVNFYGCTSLTSANFSGCSSLKTLDLSNCKSFTSANFSGCSSLQTISLSGCKFGFSLELIALMASRASIELNRNPDLKSEHQLILEILNIPVNSEDSLTYFIEDLEAFIQTNYKLLSLNDYLTDIKNKHSAEQLPLLKFIAYTAGLIEVLPENESDFLLKDRDILDNNSYLSLIYHHKFAPNRDTFMQQALKIAKGSLENILNAFCSIERSGHQTKKIHDCTKLAALLLIPYRKDEKITPLLEQINREKRYQDDRSFNILVSYLSEMIKFENNHDIVLDNFQSVLNIKSHQDRENTMKAYENISKLFGFTTYLDCIKKSIDPRSYFTDKFGHVFDLNSIDFLAEKYSRTFANFRDPLAIFVYFGRIKQLVNGESVKECFRNYLIAVLEGYFHEIRYDRTRSTHLAKVFEGEKGNAALAQWKNNRIAVSLEGSAPQSTIDYKSELYTKIITDHHLKDSENYLDLIAYLEGKNPDFITSEAKVKELYQNMVMTWMSEGSDKKELKKINTSSFIKHIPKVVRNLINDFSGAQSSDLQDRLIEALGDDYPRLKKYIETQEVEIIDLNNPKNNFQELMIKLCEGRVSRETVYQKLNQLNLDLGELNNDLNSLLRTQERLGSHFRIMETDEPCDLLMIGTEIRDSCLSVEGYDTNKCLVSYLMDGDIKALVVKQGDKIVARTLLRIMWDSKNGRRVILLERVYSNFKQKETKALLTQRLCEWAKDKARSMNCPLVTVEVLEGGEELYDGKVEFLGGLAPFTYSDASKGVKDKPFETLNCRQLI